MVKIPKRLEELLPAAAMEKVLDVLQQPGISGTVRDALNKVGLKDANPLGQVQDAWQQARSWLDALASQVGEAKQPASVINATGQLFRPEFTGVPLASSVAYGYAKSAAAFQLHAAVEARANQVARGVLGGTHVWLNAPLATLQLLQIQPATSARPRVSKIVVSRADLVRISGWGDVRSMLTAGGGQIVEVGAANGATSRDWSAAFEASTDVLLLVSPNNLDAAAAKVHRDAAIAAAKQAGATVVELLLDGVVNAALATDFGFPDAASRLAHGTDVVLLPANFLLSGPPGTLVVGQAKMVEALTEAADLHEARLQGAQLAACSLALQLASLCDEVEAGIQGQLMTNANNLKNRARRLAIQLGDTRLVSTAVEVERTCDLGPAPWDRYQLHNWAVRLTPRETEDGAAERLRRQLLGGERDDGTGVAIAAAVEGDALLIDLRFVAPEDDHEIVLSLVDDRSSAD